jgi:outer membrane biosynthesis protein TonB
VLITLRLAATLSIYTGFRPDLVVKSGLWRAATTPAKRDSYKEERLVLKRLQFFAWMAAPAFWLSLTVHQPASAAETNPQPAPAATASGSSTPVSAESATATEEDDAPPPGLDASVIKDVIKAHMPQIKHCYDVELRKDPELAGQVTLKFTVSPKGVVNQALVKQTTLNNKEVETCMVSEVKEWIFPEPRGGISVDINYPFKFKNMQ